ASASRQREDRTCGVGRRPAPSTPPRACQRSIRASRNRIRRDAILLRVRLFTIGALLGAGVWPALSVLLPFLPVPLRFLLAWCLFTFGPGVAVGGRLTRDLDPLQRVIVLLGIGSAATPIL